MPRRPQNGATGSGGAARYLHIRGLPTEITKKINKTKQTRGAQPYERVPYQNRVNRTGVAVVPYAFRGRLHPQGFANGYRILVRPSEYFEEAGVRRADFDPSVAIGQSAFVYYDSRKAWRNYPPSEAWVPCVLRDGSGDYLARVPDTTATDPAEATGIVRGEPQGIRFFEYASPEEVEYAVAQLAWLAWHTRGIDAVRLDGQTGTPEALERFLMERGLLDLERLIRADAIQCDSHSGELVTICPLCRKPIEASELMTRVEQAEGREVVDLTVTEVNLFHLKDIRPGEYNHRPYLVAWGHHHCNAAARDRGVPATVEWMAEVLRRHGYTVEHPDGRG